MFCSFDPPRLGISDLARHIVPVNVGLLEEHVQTSLVLSQRMAGNSSKEKQVRSVGARRSPGLNRTDSLVNESLQARASVLDKVLLKYAVVTPEGKLSFHCLAG